MSIREIWTKLSNFLWSIFNSWNLCLYCFKFLGQKIFDLPHSRLLQYSWVVNRYLNTWKMLIPKMIIKLENVALSSYTFCWLFKASKSNFLTPWSFLFLYWWKWNKMLCVYSCAWDFGVQAIQLGIHKNGSAWARVFVDIISE